MTKSEAKQILKLHNEWRRGGALNMQSPKDIGLALSVVCRPNEIAQSIRDAAINWPQYLGDVECEIIHSFTKNDWRFWLYAPSSEFENQCRTYMLLVAEALE